MLQVDLAQALLISRSALNNYERMKARIPRDVYEQAFQLLSVHIAPPSGAPRASPVAEINGQRIKQARQEQGLSIRALAKIAGMSEANIRYIEGGGRGTKNSLTRLQNALGLKLKIPLGVRDHATELSKPLRLRIQRSFFSGRLYAFVWPGVMMQKKELYFICEQPGAFGVVHHIFRHPEAGYLESFTDAACVDWIITEVKHAKHRGKNAQRDKEGARSLQRL